MPFEREWPCPACSELMPLGYCACPHCKTSAEWIDLLRSLDFCLRRFELWKLNNYLSGDEFRKIVDVIRQYRSGLTAALREGQPVPPDTGLMAHHECPKCGKKKIKTSAPTCPECNAPQHTPEMRLVRYQNFVLHEVKRHMQAGRLVLDQYPEFLQEKPPKQLELLKRIEDGTAPKRNLPVSPLRPRGRL